ncbi:Protein of unknown function [Bacillus mycoides]|nr:Protein of unknown function [Bacillus mycoides]
MEYILYGVYEITQLISEAKGKKIMNITQLRGI